MTGQQGAWMYARVPRSAFPNPDHHQSPSAPCGIKGLLSENGQMKVTCSEESVSDEGADAEAAGAADNEGDDRRARDALKGPEAATCRLALAVVAFIENG